MDDESESLTGRAKGGEMPELKLPEVLDQNGTQAVAMQLLDLLGHALVIDASEIRRLSAVGVEMLVSAHRQWAADSIAFEVTDWSQDALKALSVLGFDPETLRVEPQK